MTKSGGRSVIDAIEIGEVDARIIGVPSLVVSVKYALVQSSTGSRFGAGNMNVGWSAETLRKFQEFVAAAEADICANVFEDGPTTAGGEVNHLDTMDGIPGL